MHHAVLISTWIMILQSAIAQDLEWRYYGSDQGGLRHAQTNVITTENVEKLAPAWEFRTGEIEYYQGDEYLLGRAAFEATPLMVNGVLYFPTPSNRVFALNALTGQELWHFDPKLDLANLDLSEMTCRGVAYWKQGAVERLLMGTIDGRLFSIDASSGIPDSSFGGVGFVDLKIGTGLVQMTSPPVVFEDLVIAGTSVGDNNRSHAARGTVRAYQITSGKEVWRFDPIPSSAADPAMNSWKLGSAFRTGAANVWAPISIDTTLRLVFLPTSSPSPDFYGGERLGDNDYANSVVALDAKSGAYKWHFQLVHHDLWDYDVPCQPVLLDYQVAGTDIPAVAVGSKMGHIFILDRLTGRPLEPVQELTVPGSTVPGEQASLTQPFPTKPPPLGLQNLDRAHPWGPDSVQLAESEAIFKQSRDEGIFTPPSLEGSIVAPGNIGGLHWGGMSYDPNRKIIVTNINRLAYQIRLHERHEHEEFYSYVDAKRKDNNRVNPETNHMRGTPYRMSRSPLLKVNTDGKVWVQNQPPWGTVLAIDLKEGQVLWEKPLGYMGDPAQDPQVLEYGSINLGGSITTSSGLTFVAASVDNHLRAFSTSTGALLWERKLPASGIATPMTYVVEGRQFVVICAGGHGKNSLTTRGDYVLAFSLPRE